jgi:putative toxin-antitoxin system antitoxin component (TIGR02293 family)
MYYTILRLVSIMEHGTLKWFDETQGYGCIIQENGEELLVPLSAMHKEHAAKLRAGSKVTLMPDVTEISSLSGLLQRERQDELCLQLGVDRDYLRVLLHRSILLFRDSFAHAKSPQPDQVWIHTQSLNSLGQKLGIRKPLASEFDLVKLVENRLPITVIRSLLQHGISEREIYSVIVPRRTLQHRRARKERLGLEESDRAVRLARISALAERVFGDWDAGLRWLRAPQKRLQHRPPIDLVATEAGSRQVEEMLYQIDEGMAA